MKRERIGLLRCRKCEHEWLPRRTDIPKVCPRCKRYDWDRKRGSKPK